MARRKLQRKPLQPIPDLGRKYVVDMFLVPLQDLEDLNKRTRDIIEIALDCPARASSTVCFPNMWSAFVQVPDGILSTS